MMEMTWPFRSWKQKIVHKNKCRWVSKQIWTHHRTNIWKNKKAIYFLISKNTLKGEQHRCPEWNAVNIHILGNKENIKIHRGQKVSRCWWWKGSQHMCPSLPQWVRWSVIVFMLPLIIYNIHIPWMGQVISIDIIEAVLLRRKTTSAS